MAEPKKETVRIAPPLQPGQAASDPSVAKRDTARIVLPSRTPVTPIRRLPPQITPLPSSGSTTEAPSLLPRRPPVTPPASTVSSPLLQPLPKPPGVETDAEPGAAIRPVPPPRDESVTTAPTAAPAINMTKTQPLLIHPAATIPPAPVVITSKPVAPLEAISRSLAWALLAVSAVIFLIQIWNYVVS
jgi:hypothetical protein